MSIQESGEMYLESIYVLLSRKEHVRSIDICEYMSFSKPSVSRAVGNLKQSGHITVDGDGYISLTESGRALARKIYERHTILEELFVKIGVSRETASEDACRVEHHISDETFEALKNYMRSHYEKH